VLRKSGSQFILRATALAISWKLVARAAEEESQKSKFKKQKFKLKLKS
jgi:hypothetical protein